MSKNTPSKTTCIFCKMIQGEVPTSKILEDSKCYVFLDSDPINPGHCLIIPKVHYEHIWDLPEDLYDHIFKLAKKLQTTLQAVYNPEKVGLLIEGFGVNHAHVHLTPLYSGLDIERSSTSGKDQNLKNEALKITSKLTI